MPSADGLGFDDDLAALFGIAHRVIGDIFIDERHRTDGDIVTNGNIIADNAAISADIDIIANHQPSCSLIHFNADSGVLPDAEILPNDAMRVNDDPRQMRESDPFTNLRAEHNLDAILSD